MSKEGMMLTVLATELAEAVAADERPEAGGCDLSAGMFGPAVSGWLCKLATEAANAEQQTRGKVVAELRSSAFLYCDVNKEDTLLCIKHGCTLVEAKEREATRLEAAEALLREFCTRVECGEIRSVKTYAKFKDFLEAKGPVYEAKHR